METIQRRGRHASKKPGNHRNWLIDLREEKGLTQADVASQIGVSMQHYAKIESSARIGSGQVLLRLSEFYGVPVKWFFTGGPAANHNATTTKEGLTS